ncbi:MAG TPA: YggS family pyridoxal phosphate-dependent enzyme [Pyrinomonadaceae bacterium]|nr:YggS family pyridoxal phosphate-dependent enzyme [Pyrinomonadaceae bacterium]
MEETASSSDQLQERLAEVRRKIEGSAQRAGRDASEIKLVAVSKTHPPDIIRRAILAGVSDLGENRVQEADAKIQEIGHEHVRWHLIGHLQANKARRAVMLFDLIHSLDSISLARRLDRLCEETERATLPVMIQVDLGDEETKSGANESELPELVKTVKECVHLELMGLMALPPFFEDAGRVRPYFRRLRELRDELSARNAFDGAVGELSMGMSHDYGIAIEEGATIVRVGTAIFGERKAVAEK